jgi:hypothetical protein
MKPKDAQETPKAQAQPQSAKASSPPTTTSGTKRKQAGNTSAAGRKIARKTAHSLIERRRRSKMNEEFGVLKDMIPACRGQEMHKLAILQVCTAASSCGATFVTRTPEILQANDNRPQLNTCGIWSNVSQT